MQVYRRIANPYMPQGTPDKTNAPTPVYAPGEIGCAFSDQNTGGEYLRVLLDSGANSLTTVGAVQQGQTAYWKDQVRGIVTNDKNFCDAGATAAVNRVAGIFQLAVTAAPGQNGTDGLPLQYMCDLVIRRPNTPVKCKAANALIGAQAIVDTAANTAQVTALATATTAPTSQVLGVFANSTVDANGLALVNVSIGFAE